MAAVAPELPWPMLPLCISVVVSPSPGAPVVVPPAVPPAVVLSPLPAAVVPPLPAALVLVVVTPDWRPDLYEYSILHILIHRVYN